MKRLCLLIALAAPVFAAGVKVQFDPRDPAIGPFPTDYLTEPDPAQRTFKRVAMPLGNCAGRTSDCGELRLINQLDGFSPNARLTVRFSGAINPETLKAGLSYIPLDSLQSGRALAVPVGQAIAVNQMIFDPSTNTAYAKPDQILEGSRRYLVVVTDAVRDRAGDAVETDLGFQFCLEGRLGGGYCSELTAALDRVRASVAPRRIVGASLFTTMSTTAWYEQASAIVDRVSPQFRRVGDPITVSRVRAVSFRQQVATRGESRFIEDTLPLPPGFLDQFGVGRAVFGTIRSPRFIAPNQLIPAMPTSGELPMPQQTEEIAFHVWLPARPAPPGGYPVLLAGHGIGDTRFGMPSFASIGASAGFAVIAMSAVGHGYGPESSVRIVLDNGVVEIPAPGRGIDLNQDGAIDPIEGCVFIVPGAPVGARDCLRQTAVDYMQMVHAIRDGMDLDGDGTPDLNPRLITYLGQSLGSFYGAIATAMLPDIQAAVLNVGGGYLSYAARLSPSFRPLFLTSAFATREPVLINKGADFDEDMPLRNEPTRVRSVAGAAQVQDALERIEWIESLGTAGPIAVNLKRAPQPGGLPKRVLFQIALGDRQVSNPVNSQLIRAAGGEQQTSLYRFDRAKALVPDLRPDPHTFLVPLGPAQQAVISLAAFQQALTFLGSPGEAVPDVNPLTRAVFGVDLFETPNELPERTNFVP